jgi:3',5'-cyclic AMP phosphodiesterase CpdA
MKITRRDFIRLAGYGGVVFSSGLLGLQVNAMQKGQEEFYFVQMSDTHWGFNNAKFNADAKGTLRKAIDIVNGLEYQPDFVVFTGDLTHTTGDPKVRRERMAEFRDIVSALKVKNIRFVSGEHDAFLDHGEAYQEFFGELHYTFDHKGFHFIVLDNVSDPRSTLGENQLRWLEADLRQLDRKTPIVVLTHRPLFDLYPEWDWYTADGAKALKLLNPHKTVTVFSGHIHQEHHFNTDHIAHHSAKSLIFPLSAPGDKPKRKLPWDPNHSYRGLGIREVEAISASGKFKLTEIPF